MTNETLKQAANYYIRNRKRLTAQNERYWPRLTDQNINLLETVAEAYALKVSDLAHEVAEIDRQVLELAGDRQDLEASGVEDRGQVLEASDLAPARARRRLRPGPRGFRPDRSFHTKDRNAA